MERVGPQDASFFFLETPKVHQHVGGVQILDPSTRSDGRLPFADLRALVSSRLHLVPRFRQRAVFPPLPARPVWVDDPGFDLDFHLRRAALPSPGGRRELADLVQRVISRPLDRTKPLWEVYLVDGLEDGLAAVLTKVHHAVIDGVSGVDLATVLFDATPEVRSFEPVPWRPEPQPTTLDLLRDAAVDNVLHPVETVAEALRWSLVAPGLAAQRTAAVLGGVREILGAGASPPSPLNRRIGPNRRFAMAEAPLADFKAVKNALGGTVNDVVLAVVAGALHRLLHARGEWTRGRELRAMVPISVRPKGERSTSGNRLSTLFVDLPVGRMSARRRLATIRATTRDLKESHRAVSAEFLMNIGMWAPPTIHATAARLAARTRFFNLVVSNVPGPQVPLYLAGARLLAAYPFMPLGETVGLSVACTSLAGTMAFGLVGDWDTLPDLDVLARGIGEAIADLRKTAGG